MIYLILLLYVCLLVGISIFSKKLIKSDKDYLLAGRSLPFSISMFALFATWFGSETILGASQEFVKGGFLNVIEEPFGAALCLILAGIFFVKPLYRMNIMTLADFFKVRYGKETEIISSFFLITSYFGWIAAQFVAFGVVLNSLTGITLVYGIFIGFLICVSMVYFGGMWAIALTDFLQTGIIIISLFVILGYAIYTAGGAVEFFNFIPPSYFNFLPAGNIESVMEYIVAWMIIGLGSIPGQELFQRFMSSKSEKVAVYSSITAGLMYLSIALIPLFIAVFAKFKLGIDENPLLSYINTLNPFIKIMFFLGLISAIISTASAAILAPSAIISENILPRISKKFSDLSRLYMNKITVLFVSVVSLFFAFSGESIYQLVASSSIITLVSLFIPLLFGIYVKGADKSGAIFSMISGFSVWFFVDVLLSLKTVAVISGFLMSAVVMSVFSFRWILHR